MGTYVLHEQTFSCQAPRPLAPEHAARQLRRRRRHGPVTGARRQSQPSNTSQGLPTRRARSGRAARRAWRMYRIAERRACRRAPLGERHERLAPPPGAAAHAARNAGDDAGHPRARKRPFSSTLNVCPNQAAHPARAPAGMRAHVAEERDLPPRLPRERLVRDAAQAGERIRRGMRGSRRAAPARPACRRSPSRPRDAAGALHAGEPAAEPEQVAHVQDHRPRRLLDPVAVPARERVLRVLRAQPPRRA